MNTRIHPRIVARARSASVALLAVLLAGCGLAEYEDKMVASQARVQRFDDDNKYLGEPLAVPLRKVKVKQGDDKEVEQDEPVAELFLRPPRGIDPKWDDKDKTQPGLFYHYKAAETGRGGQPAPPGDDPAAVGAFTDLYLAIASEPKKFADRVVGHFPPAGPATSRRLDVQPFGRQPLSFEVTDFDAKDKTHVAVNVLLGNRTNLAVVFKMKNYDKNRDALDEARRRCLESLALDQDAAKARLAYTKRKPPPAPAPR